MSFETESDAFQDYAEAMPNNCVFLVDTYDSLAGVMKAIQVGIWLRRRGHEMIGVRLDSGDLVALSIEARRLLDEAGFPDAVIVASNDLDENLIAGLKAQGAKVAVWGVGTRLATAYDQPALGGVFKLSALRQLAGDWSHRIKLSEESVKMSTPGILQVRRFRDHGGFVADMIYDELLGIGDQMLIDGPGDNVRRDRMDPRLASEDLMVPVIRGGSPVYETPAIGDIRRKCQEQLAMLHPGVKRFVNPDSYPVGLESGLYELKMNLVRGARGMQAPAERVKPNGREETQ
jgi:nicotinate phosphoribosyltransferase